MIIIIEGIDRVGKSTLCKELSSKFNIPIYQHIGKRDLNEIKSNSETEKNLQILEICRLTNAFIIFDRLQFTECVYGIVQRGYEEKEAMENFKKTDEFIVKNLADAILILVSPTDIKRSSEEHGRDLSEHNILFDLLYEKSAIKNKFNCTYKNLFEAVEFVSAKINENLGGKCNE